MWKYEVYDRKTHELKLQDSGFNSESEAEYNARLDASAAGIVNYYVRTLPDKI